MHCTRGYFVMMPLGFLVALGIFMSAVYFQLGAPTAQSHWCFEINRKKQEAATKTPSPKLVLLGGSATLFGVKASLLERELGVRTLNAATHAGLGMAYLLDHGKQFLHAGDTVILLPEFELLDYGEHNRAAWASSLYVDYILAGDPDYYRRLGAADQVEIAMMVPMKRLLEGVVSRIHPEPPVRFADFNAYDPVWVDVHGDMTGHTAQRRPATCPKRDEVMCEPLHAGLPVHASGMPLMADFCKWAASHNIRVMASFPNLADHPSYDTATTRAVECQMQEFFAARGVPVIGNLHDVLLPSVEFFDTNYHPTEEASVRRTVRFASLLKPWFPAGVAVAPATDSSGNPPRGATSALR